MRIQIRPSRNEDGLIELLVLISIIAILAGMLLPALAKWKQKSLRAKAMQVASTNGLAAKSSETNPAASNKVETVEHAPEASMFENGDLFASVANSLLVAVGSSLAGASLLASRGLILTGFKGRVEFANERETEDIVSPRKQEAESELKRQNGLVRRHRMAALILTTGQVVLGGLLASSFPQQKLTKDQIGAIGLLVLASSLVRQRYNPELKQANALERAAELQILLREVEDHLAARTKEIPDALSETAIRSLITEKLNKITNSELQESKRGAKDKP